MNMRAAVLEVMSAALLVSKVRCDNGAEVVSKLRTDAEGIMKETKKNVDDFKQKYQGDSSFDTVMKKHRGGIDETYSKVGEHFGAFTKKIHEELPKHIMDIENGFDKFADDANKIIKDKDVLRKLFAPDSKVISTCKDLWSNFSQNFLTKLVKFENKNNDVVSVLQDETDNMIKKHREDTQKDVDREMNELDQHVSNFEKGVNDLEEKITGFYGTASTNLDEKCRAAIGSLASDEVNKKKAEDLKKSEAESLEKAKASAIKEHVEGIRKELESIKKKQAEFKEEKKNKFGIIDEDTEKIKEKIAEYKDKFVQVYRWLSEYAFDEESTAPPFMLNPGMRKAFESCTGAWRERLEGEVKDIGNESMGSTSSSATASASTAEKKDEKSKDGDDKPLWKKWQFVVPMAILVIAVVGLLVYVVLASKSK